MIAFLLLAQATAAPDIQLDARADIKRVTIVKRGDASLKVTAEPDAGSIVDVRAPRANGRKTMRNVHVEVRAEARIADPSVQVEADAKAGETSSSPLR